VRRDGPHVEAVTSSDVARLHAVHEDVGTRPTVSPVGAALPASATVVRFRGSPLSIQALRRPVQIASEPQSQPGSARSIRLHLGDS
jgi:hypothetical protein